MSAPVPGEQQFEGRSVLIAWTPNPRSSKFRERLEDALVADGAEVENILDPGEIETAVDSDNPPDLLVVHLNFPKIGAANLIGLLREPLRFLIRPIAVLAVSRRLIGADRSQFRVDLGADELVTEDDSIEDVLRAVQGALAHPPARLPVVYLHTGDPHLERELEETLLPLGHCVEVIESLDNFTIDWRAGGILLVKENLLIKKSRIDGLSKNVGVVVLLEKPDAEAARKLMTGGAIDCITPGVSTKDIASRCRAARRHRARKLLEKRLEDEIRQEAMVIEDKHVVVEAREEKTRYESRYDEMFQNDEVAYITHDFEGNIDRVNSKTTEIFGYSKSELEKMKIGELHPPGIEKQREKNFSEFITKEKHRFESFFQRADGTTFPGSVSARYSKEKGSSGKSVIISSILNIEKAHLIGETTSLFNRLETEAIPQAIDDTLEKLGRLTGIERCALYVAREAGKTFEGEEGKVSDGEGKVLNLEHQWFADGYDPGTPLQKVLSERSSRVLSHLNAVGKASLITSGDFITPHARELSTILKPMKQGMMLAIPLVCAKERLGVFLSAAKDDGKVEGLGHKHTRSTHTIETILEVIAGALYRRKRERAIQKGMMEVFEMDKKVTIGTLSSGIAHDYRNLLTGVLGNASHLLSLDGVKSNPAIRKSLLVIEKAADRGVELSKDLLAFVKHGKKQEEEFGVHKTIEQVCGLLEHSISPKIRLQTRLDSEADILHGDRGQMTRALMNLLINASEALSRNDRGGTIAVSTQLIESSSVSFFEPDPMLLEIRIEDDGPGIPGEDQTKIFEPYFSTKEEKYKGTGLGLWVVDEVIRGHGGTIRLESSDVGTCFLVHLPLAAIQRVDESGPGKIIKGSGRILLIDDDDLVRQTAHYLLDALEYEVDDAVDGSVAFEMYRSNPKAYDLVLLDQNMPVLSGAECLQKLIEVNSEVRVVITSGEQISDFPENTKDNIVGVLPKPYTLQVLSYVISEALKSRDLDEVL